MQDLVGEDEPTLETRLNTLFADALPRGSGRVQETSLPSAGQPVESRDLETPPRSAPPVVWVDAQPRYRANPLPEYPYRARVRHWQGNVWLLVDVDASGRVESLEVERSSGHAVLDRAARQAVRRWQFMPALRAGVPVASQVRVPVRFELDRS